MVIAPISPGLMLLDPWDWILASEWVYPASGEKSAQTQVLHSSRESWLQLSPEK